MLPFAIHVLLTFIELPFVIKIFVLSIFEWPCYTGFTVDYFMDRISKILKYPNYSALSGSLQKECQFAHLCLSIEWLFTSY